MPAMPYGESDARRPIEARRRIYPEGVSASQPQAPARLVAVSSSADAIDHGERSAHAASGSDRRPAPKYLIGSRIRTYLITEKLGAGGAAEVYKGIDLMLKRDVAIKVLRAENARDPAFLERFRHEAQLLARLNHPNIARVYAFLNEGDTQFLVMEYLPGISLDAFIRASGPVPAERALHMFRAVLEGIGHAHRCGIVHRDLKPANIMLTEEGAVKVMDFGIARALGSDHHLTLHGQVPGTARYMSPEQVRGEEVDARSDIYSLGVVLYMLLCGRAPFDGKSMYELLKSQVEQMPPPLRTLVAGVPAALEAVVARALAKNPSDRYESVEAFRDALDACIAASRQARPAQDTKPPQRLVARSHALCGQVSRETLAWIGARAKQLASHCNTLAARLPAIRLRPTAAASLAWLRQTDRRTLAALTLAPLALGAALALRFAPSSEPLASSPTLDPLAPLEWLSQPRPDADAPKPALSMARLPLGTPARTFRPGDRVQVQVEPRQDAYVYCYLQDEAGRIVRLFPNRFRPSAQVKAATPLHLPGTMPFELVANAWMVNETIACFATERDVIKELPAAVVGTDFENLRISSLDQLTDAFDRVAGSQLEQARFAVQFD